MLKFRNINETSHHINLIMRTPDGFIYSLSNVLVKGEVVTVNNDPFSTPINNKVVTMADLAEIIDNIINSNVVLWQL